MKYSKTDEIDYKIEMNKYSSIKNSKFFDIINNNNIQHLKDDDLNEFILFMQSLSEDEICLLIHKILDDEYPLDCNFKTETPEDRVIRIILNSDIIREYFDIIFREEF